MGRGKSLHTQVKKAVLQGASVAAAIDLAKGIAYQKLEEKKPLELSLREHAGKMIDRIDPLELAAMLGMTVMVHDTYDWTTSKLSNIKMKSGTTFLGLTRKSGSTLISELGETLSKVPDPLIWVISFIASFYVLRHGKDISSAVTSVIALLGL